MILMLILLCAMHVNLGAQERYWISGKPEELSFTEFVKQIESELPVKFFYREDWLHDLRIGPSSACRTLPSILDSLFNGTSLHYFMEESGNIIITDEYVVKVEFSPTEASQDILPERPLDGAQQQTSGHASVEIGNPAEKNRHGKVIVSGYITDKDTGEPLPGVSVYISQLSTGTMTNEYGYFKLAVPRGAHQIRFSSIGAKDRMIDVNLYGAGELNVEMSSMITPLKEVVVTAEKSITLQRFEVGAERINMTSLKLLPTSLGESDILKSILLIPGVQSVGEGSAGFNVRGGSADQNLILLYGAPVYNSSHFFGFFSAVNADIIRDVTLYKGGIPGKYGGRISSVLDIVTKEGNRKEFAGSAGISPVTAHLMVEGPIIKDSLTYLFAARTTYSNWLLSLVENDALSNSRASFYDLNGKMTYDWNKNNKIDLSAYFSHDSFRFNSDTTYSYDNSIYALKWRHFFSSKLFSSLSVNNSFYRYDVSSGQPDAEAFVHTHKMNSTGIKADFNWFPGKNEFNFGLDLTRYAVNPGIYLPDGDSSLVVPRSIEKEQAWEGALYVEDKFMLKDYLSISLGMRLSAFYALGPQTVRIYNPAYPKSRSTITDTLRFSPGEITGKYGGPEFRISLNFRITERNSLKINYNRTRQYLHLLSNSASISPTDTWKLSDYYLEPQVGDQIAAGFYKLMFSSLEISAELYYKWIRNMVDFKGGTNLIMNENIESAIVNLKGKAYGAELSVKKTSGKLRYSIGYTYSRTFVRSTGAFSEEMINKGSWFPANFDKPHDLVVTFNYLLSRRFSFSSNYTYSTGRPITFPVATYIMYDNELVHYSDRNRYRIPDYSRFDVSFRINGNLRSKKIAHPGFTFSIYNLLGRENVYSVYFKKEGELIRGYKLSVFGVAIPSVTFSFDF